jgi:hydrogenase expression/formation protein HypE
MTRRLIESAFLPAFRNEALMRGDDAAVVDQTERGRLALATDAHIVSPLFFPGGDIGRLAVCGAVNDLAMVGAVPSWLTASFILEEGFPMDSLLKIIDSMQSAAEEAKVEIVAGDTKVTDRGKGDGVFISTTSAGWVPEGRRLGGAQAELGDVVLLSGTVGDHGIAVLSARGDLEFESTIRSDIAPLNGLVEAMFRVASSIHVLRDPTRGGVATALNEIAQQSQVSIRLEEALIPVDTAVLAACEMLGFDPLYLANEGKLLAIVAPEVADKVLGAMRSHPYGEGAQRIGVVASDHPGRVLMNTLIGSTRIVDVLSGEMLPRIC